MPPTSLPQASCASFISGGMDPDSKPWLIPSLLLGGDSESRKGWEKRGWFASLLKEWNNKGIAERCNYSSVLSGRGGFVWMFCWKAQPLEVQTLVIPDGINFLQWLQKGSYREVGKARKWTQGWVSVAWCQISAPYTLISFILIIRGSWLFSLEKRRLQEHLRVAFQYLKGTNKEDVDRRFSKVCWNKTKVMFSN